MCVVKLECQIPNLVNRNLIHAFILKAIKNATFYKAFSMQKVYIILEAMAIKVKNNSQAHLIVKLFQYRKLPFDI